jgi:hypothetical protein
MQLRPSPPFIWSEPNRWSGLPDRELYPDRRRGCAKEADPRDKAIHDPGRLSIEKKALMTTKILFSATGSFISCQYKKELALANV